MRDILDDLEEKLPTGKEKPRDILDDLDEEAAEIPSEELSTEELPDENKYGEVGHQKVAGMTTIPEEHKDILGDFAESVAIGTHRDVIKLNNFLASHPITKTLLHPLMGDLLKERKEPELGEAPMPKVAGVTAALTPWMLPYGAAAKGVGLTGLATKAGAKALGELPMLAKGLETVVRTHPIMTKAGELFGKGATEMGAIERVFGEEGDDASKLGKAALAGGILNLVSHGMFNAVPNGLRRFTNSLKKAAEIKGDILNPEETASVADLFKGDDVLNLPDLIRTPKLSSFYHGLLKWMPGSAIAKKEKDMIGHMERSGASAMNDLLGKVGEKVEPVDVVKLRKGIAGEVADVGNEIKNKSNKLYNEMFEQAETSKFKFQPTKVADLAKEYEEKATRAGESVKDIAGTDFSKILEDFTGVLKEEVPMMAGKPVEDVRTLEAIRKAQRKAGIEPKRPVINMERFKELRSEVGSKYFRKRGTGEGRKWGELYNAINEDFEIGAKESGNEKLIPLFKKANDYYREEYVPFFKNKKVEHIMRGRQIKGKTDFVEKTLTDSDNEKILNYLPNETKNKLSYLMLDKGIKDNGEPVVPRVVKAFKGLKEYDKEKVLTPVARKKFEELSKKYDVAKPSYKSLGDNVMKGIHEITRSRHIAQMGLAGVGGALGAGFVPHLAGLIPFVASGAALGRGLGSKGLLEAYTKGIIPGEKAAPKIAKKVAKAAKMGISLAELSDIEERKSSEEFEKRSKKRLEDLKRKR